MRPPLASLAVAASLMTGCTSLFVGPDAEPGGAAVFEHLWHDLDRHYVFFIVKGVNWDSLHDVYAPRAARAATDGQLSDVVLELLRELRDPHVSLSVGSLGYGYDRTGPAFFDPTVVRARYVTDRRLAPRGRLHFGTAAPGVGYVWIPSFRGSEFGADLDSALSQLGSVRALIVDVRGNGGGSTRNPIEVAGRFADRERIYAFLQLRNGPRHDDFTPREPLTVSPAAAPRFAGPVAVLTDRRCMSGTEEFVLAMRVLPAVVVVGDSTVGAYSNPLPRELPNGWNYGFSMSLQQTLDSTIYEEIGLAPDVWVRGSAEELAAGRDAVLDTALARLGAETRAARLEREAR